MSAKQRKRYDDFGLPPRAEQAPFGVGPVDFSELDVFCQHARSSFDYTEDSVRPQVASVVWFSGSLNPKRLGLAIDSVPGTHTYI